MSTTTQQPATNDLRHTINCIDAEGNQMQIKISLNDECKNGHQDFAITATTWEKGKPKIDKYSIMAGCCHDEILKAKPELEMFVTLHLCDYKGIPMHAVENGFYHLQEGFSDTKPDSPEFKAEFCKYYRITGQQFDRLNKSENKIQYAVLLEKLGILDQWEEEANAAIKLLESWTGEKLLIDSKRTQYHAPTAEELQEEEKRQKEGYYTAEAKEQRKKDAENKLMHDLHTERDQKLATIAEEYDIKEQVLSIGGGKALDNCIYYSHNKTIAFNWKGYDQISQQLIDKIISQISLPLGATIENKKK